jgi:hypothetical protein
VVASSVGAKATNASGGEKNEVGFARARATDGARAPSDGSATAIGEQSALARASVGRRRRVETEEYRLSREVFEKR